MKAPQSYFARLLLNCSLLLVSLLSSPMDLQAQTPEGTNLALRKPASASSVFPSQTPDKALDGVLSEGSKWTSASGKKPPHSLTIDLGNVRSINGFVVKHAGAAGEMKGFNTQAFRIEGAPFLSGPWIIHATVDNQIQDPISTVNLPTPKNMRFVRLVVTDPGIDDYARIPEFEVYGPPIVTDHFTLGLNSNAPINAQSGNAGLNNDPNVMADTGSAWVRVNFILGPWTAPDDPTPHGPQGLTWFETYDRIIDGYLEQGVRIYGLIGLEAVRMPEGVADPRAYLQTEEYADLYVANWLKILDHFRDRVRVIESVNEPNDWAGGTSALFSPSSFARLIAKLYLATKIENGHAVDPSWSGLTLVTGPLFVHNLDNGASFWQETISAGRTQFGWDQIKAVHGCYPYDGIGIHYYIREGTEPPADTVSGIRASANAMNTITRTLEGNFHTKKFYCSEFGFRDDYTGSRQATVDKMKACVDFFRSDGRYALAEWFSLTDFTGAYYGLFTGGDLTLQYRKTLTWCGFRTSALGPLPAGTQKLVNGGFEAGSLDPWVQFGQTDGVLAGAQFNVQPAEGNSFFGAAANYDQKNGGVYQRVPVTPGRILHARTMVNTYREGGAEKSTSVQIGIDPTGGTDPESPKVAWSRAIESPDCLVPLDVQVPSLSEFATVFLRHKQAAPVWNVTAFDAVSLIETESPAPQFSSNMGIY